MLVTSRRNLILGIGSLIAAPALVKASSLMPLRGYDMDPYIIGYRHTMNLDPLFSFYNFEATHEEGQNFKRLSLDKRIELLNSRKVNQMLNPTWVKVRASTARVPDTYTWDPHDLVLIPKTVRE